jgi:anhydro-N-acetylmuramic acid kinase
VRTLRVLGLMSGTSLDGVDGALCECRPDSVRQIHLASLAFPRKLRHRLHVVAAGEATSWEMAQLHHDLGRFYAAFAAGILPGRRVHAVALHGQTVFHQPEGPGSATLQLGEPAWIAEALGVPVIANFRSADLAAGGQGAPLATLFHQVVFARRGRHVAIQNLGGIGNVTAIDWTGSKPRVQAFDTGPANLLMDAAMRALSGGRQAMDRDGRLARRGLADAAVLDELLEHPFLRAKPPKSTGREMFGEALLEPLMRRFRGRGPDLLATLTEFTARSVALNYRLHLRRRSGWPDEVVLCGGGGANGFLVARLIEALRAVSAGMRVISCEELGWPRQAVEPAAFALLGAYRLWGLPGNLPATTGARGPRLLGQRTDARPGDYKRLKPPF